jgi:integrase/recombinase XerD
MADGGRGDWQPYLFMHWLQGGVDITVTALWLGHESPVTTHGHVEADLSTKHRR